MDKTSQNKRRKKIAHKQNARRRRIIDAFGRDKFLTSRDLTPSHFVDLTKHVKIYKRQNITASHIFTRDFFKNQNASRIDKTRINNANIKTAQNIRDAVYNKKLDKQNKRDAVAYYTNGRRRILDVDKIYIDVAPSRIIDGVNIGRVYFKNNATRDAYIINNLSSDVKKQYTRDLSRIAYKTRQNKRKHATLDKICDKKTSQKFFDASQNVAKYNIQ